MQKDLLKRYLDLFSRSWNHSLTREGFARLSQETPESADGLLGVLLQARLAAQANRADHALALLDAALKKHPRDACALLLKARILCLDKQKPKDALKVYHRLYRLQFDASAIGKWLWSLAVTGSATALTKLKKFPQSAARHEEVITRLARVRNPQLRLQLARAMVGKAFCQLRQGLCETALEAADAAIARFGRTDSPELQEHLARAMVIKGLVHGELDRHREALEAFERVIQWFGAVERLETREVVLTAWVNRGVALRKLDMAEDALAAFDALVERFEDDMFPEVQEAVAMALISRSAARLDSGNPPYWRRLTVPPHREG